MLNREPGILLYSLVMIISKLQTAADNDQCMLIHCLFWEPAKRKDESRF